MYCWMTFLATPSARLVNKSNSKSTKKAEILLKFIDLNQADVVNLADSTTFLS